MAKANALELLQKEISGMAELNVPMRERTTMRTGGNADILIAPVDREDLAKVVKFLAEREIGYFVLGGGSGIIVRDGGIRGAVIALKESFDSIEAVDDEAGGTMMVRAEAGVMLGALVKWAASSGISGFESLAGIPGTLGGALYKNSGGWGESIGQRVEQLEIMDSNAEIHTLLKRDFSFGYRTSNLPTGTIILSASFAGKRTKPDEVMDVTEEWLDKRMMTQPFEAASVGMVFKNPEVGLSAGELIDRCGLKGIRVGDAEVSCDHANYITNIGEATASQLIALIGMVQERVYVKHKVRLSLKVGLVGSSMGERLRIRK
ncbi:MAG: UDP-N-acetylenolpyruvoylglucosamine reductase [Deltaproteobacteria bacterium]|nr:MAG: UDP-N-acetylenolpyruvoylglucosamine reductase [Deltaproteobacteria bacterium]